jgi:hypothetical protein
MSFVRIDFWTQGWKSALLPPSYPIYCDKIVVCIILSLFYLTLYKKIIFDIWYFIKIFFPNDNIKVYLKDISIMHKYIYNFILKIYTLKKRKVFEFYYWLPSFLGKKKLIVTSIVTKMVDLDTSCKRMVEMDKIPCSDPLYKTQLFFFGTKHGKNSPPRKP